MRRKAKISDKDGLKSDAKGLHQEELHGYTSVPRSSWVNRTKSMRNRIDTGIFRKLVAAAIFIHLRVCRCAVGCAVHHTFPAIGWY